MPRLRVRYRILRFWLCRKRGHDVGNDQLVLAWYSPDRLNPDGTITPGDSFEQWTMACHTCPRRGWNR